MTNLKVFGCKELSVLKDYKANVNDQEQVIKTLKDGEVVSIDTSKTYWSLDDRQYYKINLPDGRDGYVIVGALRMV